ncbi:MAG TPA: DNA polymerase [Candidatus Paceibacterota bacterium]
MARFPHRLTGGRRTEAPGRFLFVDTETAPVPVDSRTTTNPLWFGAAMYWRRPHNRISEREIWHDFSKVTEFWDIVDHYSEDRQSLCIFAQNFGFDLQVLGGFAAMRARGWEIKSAIIDSPPFIVKARRGGQALLLLDWLNYFRGSLAESGELLGVPKLKMPEREAPFSDWTTYCRNDVLVLYRAVRKYLDFLSTYDMGTFAQTLAGQSLNAYRHRFMSSEIFIHTNSRAVELERECYYGGRVEMFRRNILPPRTYTYLDINSAYPTVMRDGVFPTALRGMENSPSLERLSTLAKSHLLVAGVWVRTEFPVLPKRQDGRLLFPVGEFYTTLATPELLLALNRGLVTSCDVLAYYDGENIFKSWVEEIYALRKDAKLRGDHMYDELLKRLMNSLFGKFGQRNYEWETIDEHSAGPDHIWRQLDRDTGAIYTLRRLGGVLQIRRSVEEGFNSLVAIASHVTAAARVLLLGYIERAGWEHTYYCDTDSLIVDGSGAIRLRDYVNPTTLGALKIEGRSGKVRLGAPKNYTFGDKVKHKGRRKNAVPVGHGAYEQDQFVSLVGALRIGWEGGPLIRRIVKHDRMTYRKGVVNDDDSISPIRLFRP